MINYKGYTGTVQFDAEADLFHGEVLGLRDVVTFQGRSVEEIKAAFQDSVDDYLEFCGERGEEPDKSFSGKFLVRIDPKIHRRLYELSAGEGESLNSWLSSRLEEAVREYGKQSG